MDFKNYFKELKRRNVFKAALAYLVLSWIILQVITIVFPLLRIPESASRIILVILIIGFPLWLIFAWIYELTPEGLKKTEKVEQEKSITHETSNKFNKLIIAALGVAIILLGANLYSNYSQNELPTISQNKVEARDKSIAVLAFENMSSDEDQEYFADGISEEILNYLAKNPDLEVISRTSSFYFKDKEATTKEIGQKLHVNYLLEGSVRKAGDMVRITAQLINISTGIHIWSETYDRKLDDIFKIQDEIAEAVTTRLEASLLGQKVHETDTRAYTLYLKAKHLYDQSNIESLTKALALLKEAATIDPNYAPIWELMSETYSFLGFNSPNIPKNEAYDLGFKAAKRSVEVDPDYAKGYMELAKWTMTQFEFEQAKSYAQKAIALAPENPDILRRKGLITFESIPKVIRANKKALELDPLLYALHYNLGLIHYMERDYKSALKEMNIYEEYQPGATVTSSFKTIILLGLGRTQEALQEIEKEPDPFWKSYGKIKVLYQNGQQEEALQLFENFRKEYPKEPVNIADVYAFMGDREKTFEWLQKALEIKDPTLTEAVYYPTFRKFQDDPRWQKLLEEMGVPEDNGIPGYKKS